MEPYLQEIHEFSLDQEDTLRATLDMSQAVLRQEHANAMEDGQDHEQCVQVSRISVLGEERGGDVY